MEELKIGDKAPELAGTDQNGNPVSLKDYAGKKLLLYFYPKDDTPGCTAEACDLRDHYGELKKAGYEILGVSVDDAKKHTRFIEKYNLPFSLLADIDKQTVENYGVWIEKSMYGRKYMGIERSTFLIGKDGKIAQVWRKVKVAGHAEAVLEAARKLT